jgi:hypothetical protein
MIEYAGLALAGLIVFGIGLLKFSPIRAGERGAEILLAIISGICLLFILGGAFEPAAGRPGGAIARLAALWVGAVCGYIVYRLYRLRVPPQPERSRLQPGPRLPPGYEAENRRMDQLFQAMRADMKGGTLSPEKKQAYLKALKENDALLKQYRRQMPPQPVPPHLPPEYAGLSREADRTFQAMKDAVARGEEPSEQDEAMLQKTQRQGRVLQRVGFVLAALFLVYLVIQFLAV